MSKEAIKKDLGYDGEYNLVDTHRLVPKSKGGVYDITNVKLLTPVEHMKEHGNYRDRDLLLEDLKSIVDDRKQVMKLKQKVDNQLGAYERKTDVLNDITKNWLEEQSKHFDTELVARNKLLTNKVKQLAKVDKLTASALGVKGVGPVTIAYCLVYVDIEKARHASSLWAYAGLDKASHDRYSKGVAGGGNKTLRTALYTLADSQIKTRGPYREVYNNVKNRLSHSEKVTMTRNTQGKLVESKWKDTKPGHRDGAAKRQIMKHFLADYWMVARTIAGLPTDPLYAEAVLGGNHRTIMPEERGWIY